MRALRWEEEEVWVDCQLYSLVLIVGVALADG